MPNGNAMGGRVAGNNFWDEKVQQEQLAILTGTKRARAMVMRAGLEVIESNAMENEEEVFRDQLQTAKYV